MLNILHLLIIFIICDLLSPETEFRIVFLQNFIRNLLCSNTFQCIIIVIIITEINCFAMALVSGFCTFCVIQVCLTSAFQIMKYLSRLRKSSSLLSFTQGSAAAAVLKSCSSTLSLTSAWKHRFTNIHFIFLNPSNIF